MAKALKLRRRFKQLPLEYRREGAREAPYVFTKLAPAKPSVIYDTYWRFAVERQEIFYRRLKGLPPPWTDDEILRSYKFTNAYRASDRVSQFLIRHVLYEGEQSLEEIFFRVILFKLFNRIDTWQLFQETLGEVSYRDFSFDRYDHVLVEALRKGRRIYSAAYIMPPGRGQFADMYKHRSHLRLLGRLMGDNVPARIAKMKKMVDAFELLRSYDMLGDFLAYQFVIDLNYGPLTQFTEREFVVAGPGAKAGIRKCFDSLGGLRESDLIRVIVDRQEAELARLGLDFETLWGRPLQLVDAQNLFCEVDKYSRARHPDVVDRSGRTRIKQKFRPTSLTVEPWYPPKWGINERVAQSSRKWRVVDHGG